MVGHSEQILKINTIFCTLISPKRYATKEQTNKHFIFIDKGVSTPVDYDRPHNVHRGLYHSPSTFHLNIILVLNLQSKKICN